MLGLAGLAGLVLALAVAPASYASTPTRPSTSPTQRTAARDTEASAPLAITTADTSTLRYEAYAPRYRHAYATFIVATKGHVWTTFRLGGALSPRSAPSSSAAAEHTPPWLPEDSAGTR